MTPKDNNFFMPAEWHLHQGTFISWPHRESLWINNNPNGLINARTAYTNVANAIAEFEPVYMIVDKKNVEQVKKLCSSAIQILEMSHDDSWIRDNGPTFVINHKGEIAGINWQFNAWGEKYFPFTHDNLVASKILSHFNIQQFDVDTILEGGAIHVNGNGLLITTSECVLNANRNKNFTKEKFTKLVNEYLGINEVIWLPFGLYKDETDGHVDNVACFVDTNHLLIQSTSDETDPNFIRFTQNLQTLKKYSKTNKLEITLLEQPPIKTYNNDRLTLSYINYYLVNDGLILPTFKDHAKKHDANAISILKELFPKRKIIALDGNEIIKGGGNIHCITQQFPKV